MMNRLQKKCVIASTGVHLLLAVMLFLGSGFFSASKRTENVQDLQFLFVPDILTANGPSGGGHPNAVPPPLAPALRTTPVTQTRAAEKVKEPDPPKETKTTKADKSELESLESKKPKLSARELNLVNRNKDSNKSTKKASASDDEERKLAAARKEASDLIRRTAGGLSASSATTIEDLGPRGSGPTYASYASWVQMVYLDAWAAPEDSGVESAVAEVSVTIANDGTVVSSKFLSRSGDAQVDASVQRTLNRVSTMSRPFPEGMKDKHRTYILHFDLKTKRGLA